MARAVNEDSQSAIRFKSTDFLTSLKLFAELPYDELKPFVCAARIKNYKKGQFVFHENEDAGYFYIVSSGWLKLFHTTPEGEEMVLGMLTKDGIAGVRAICEDTHFAMSAKVMEDSEILSIPIALLQEGLRTSNKLALNMLSYVVQQKLSYEQQLKQYVLYSAPQRIGSFLLGLCSRHQHKDGTVINLPYDKALIASVLWMKAPTFSRALNILREETDILINGANVTIDSIDRLLAFVGGCYSPPHQHKS